MSAKPPPKQVITFVDFVTKVLGVKLTKAQLVLSKIAFDGVQPKDLSAEEKELAREIFGDIEEVTEHARKVFVAVCGARSGKSYILIGLRMLFLALTVPLDRLAPGEPGYTIIVAPDIRLARQSLNYARGAAMNNPRIKQMIIADSSDHIELKRETGQTVRIECLPATRGGSALRGRTMLGAALDESAFFKGENSVVNDKELYDAVAPRVIMGGQTIVASTPWAESGLLYRLFSKNHGKPKTALAAHAPTLLMRGYHPEVVKEVERERENDPDNARREFDAEFVSAGSEGFFSPELVESCVDDTLDPDAALKPKSGDQIAAGADLGFTSDSSALAIVHKRGDTRIVAELVELRPKKDEPLKPSEVFAVFTERLKAHGATTIMSDVHYRESIREHLDAANIYLNPAPNAPADAFVRVRALMRQGRVKFARNTRLINQLLEVRSKNNTGGKISIYQPRKRAYGGRLSGGHGDLVSAAILALYQLHGEDYEVAGEKRFVPGSDEWRAEVYRRQMQSAEDAYTKRGSVKSEIHDSWGEHWN